MDTQALQTLIDQGNASTSGRRVQTRRTELGPRHEVQMIATTPANALQRHLSYPQVAPQLFILPTVAAPNAMPAPPSANPILVPFQKREPRKFDILTAPMSQLLLQFLAANLITTVPPKPTPDLLPRWWDLSAKCEFHQGGSGHVIGKCFILRHCIQDLLDKNLLQFKVEQEVKPNVIQNPLPSHLGPFSARTTNEINNQEGVFNPGQLITSPGTQVRLEFEDTRENQ